MTADDDPGQDAGLAEGDEQPDGTDEADQAEPAAQAEPEDESPESPAEVEPTAPQAQDTAAELSDADDSGSHVAEEVPAAAPDATAGASVLVRGAQLFGLCGFAFAYPLFAILATGATFFVAHGADRGTILLFVAVVLLVPPLVLLALVQLVALVSARAALVTMAVLFGLLVALTVVSAVDRAATLTVPAYLVSAVVLAALAGWGYQRLAPVRTFASFLSPAPLLFLVSFLFLSPVSALVVQQDPEAAVDTNSRRTPVVVVVFDELPLGALLRPDGQIDAERFPGFARLAATSTWYPEATTVAPATHLAMPALLTGTLADADDLPVAASHPRSLFTMLESTHRLEVHESVTRICPASSCEAEQEPAATGAIAQDSAVVLGHQLLPEQLAERWLPDIGGSWSDFGADTELPATAPPTDGDDLDDEEWRELMMSDSSEDQRIELARLVETIGGPSPTLWYHHQLLPHLPVKYLPDGTEYDRYGHPEGLIDSGRFVSDPHGSDALRQRFLMQVRFVDEQLRQLLERMDATGLLDPALMVVVADHGMSFEPGGDRRAGAGLTEVNRDEVLPVPLFVKYPGQEVGEVDHRLAQTVDVLPTIADQLEVQLPDEWQFDGRSLAPGAPAAPAGQPRWWSLPSGEVVELDDALDPTTVAEVIDELFGPAGGPHDLYALGPHGALVGQQVALLRGEPRQDVLLQASGAWSDGEASTDAPLFPAFLQAAVLGMAPGSPVAVAVDGQVAGTGVVFEGRNGPSIEVMLDPLLFAEGVNEVEVFAVVDGELPLQPLFLAR